MKQNMISKSERRKYFLRRVPNQDDGVIIITCPFLLVQFEKLGDNYHIVSN